MKYNTHLAFSTLVLGTLLFVGAGCGKTATTNTNNSNAASNAAVNTTANVNTNAVVNEAATTVNTNAVNTNSAVEVEEEAEEEATNTNTAPVTNTSATTNVNASTNTNTSTNTNSSTNTNTTAAITREVTMTAKQFEFSPATITVNQGDTVKLNVKSTDVTHGFAIPDFDVNMTLSPGKISTTQFVASKKGTFRFFCSIVCGSGHSGMDGTLVVQ